VTRTEYDGTISVIADHFDGKPLNSPNDIVCKSGRLDLVHRPAVRHPRQLRRATSAKPELPTNVYRWDPKTQKLAVAAGDVNRPNGLAFSPDESKLYVIEAGATPRIVEGLRRGRRRHEARQGPHVPAGRDRAARPTASGSMSTATCGWAGAWEARRSTASTSSTAKPSSSGASTCPSAAPTCASAAVPQPPLHGGEHLGVLALRQHAGRGGRIKKDPRRIPARVDE
jgi:gluconolactonase